MPQGPPIQPAEQGQLHLLEALSATDRLSDLLPLLHQQAVNAVHGRAAILFQFDPSGEWLQATSALGLDRLPPEPCLASDGLVSHTLFRDGCPVVVTDLSRSVRGMAEHLGTASVVLVPLARQQVRIGVSAVGCAAAPAADRLASLIPVGQAFTLALERSRNAREADLRRELRTLLQDFSRAGSSSLNMAPALEALCTGTNRLFAAERSSVWLHERRARVLVLSASSDATYLTEVRQVSTADAHAPAVIALRRAHAEIALDRHNAPGTGTMTIPLKGRRRALGTFVMDGVRLEAGSKMEVLERANELGCQLSAALENVMLLEDVLRSRRELDNTFNSLADLVAVCNRDGHIVHANQAFSDRAGISRRELIDRPLGELVGPATARLLSQALARGPGQEEQAINAEIEDPALGGTFLITLTPLSLPGGEMPFGGAVLVARDITPHAQLEAERAELRNKLVQSEKLAALGQFVAGIAHELNNPLQGVLGHLELLRATGAFPKVLRRDMQRIYREADRAAKIVRNLLVFAGSRRLARRRTSVNASLSRVLAFRAPAFRAAGIDIIRRHDEGLPRVKSDPLLLQQALLNIVLNAEQAVGTNGRIETRTRFQSDASCVVVEIRDTGPGIPTAVLPRIFEPFYTTKEVGKGTGLGLAIAYGIIQEHGGQISAANHPEGGAVFTVQLPVEPG